MTKRQLIDEIVSLNQTAQPAFLARFDDDDLRSYLQHLRTARQPRLTTPTGRFDRYFKPVPPATELVRPVTRPAASSTWRIEPATSRPIPQAVPVPLALAAAGPCCPSENKKDAAAEVEQDRLADEDLDLAIRRTSRPELSLNVRAEPALPPVSTLTAPPEELVQDEPATEEPAARAADDMPAVESIQRPDQPLADLAQTQAEQDLLAEGVTADEKAALADLAGADDLDGPQAELYEETEADAFEAPLPQAPPADTIQAIQDVLEVAQPDGEIDEPDLVDQEAGSDESFETDPLETELAQEAPATAGQDLVSALEAEPVEPDLQPASPAGKGRSSRRKARDDNDAWLF